MSAITPTGSPEYREELTAPSLLITTTYPPKSSIGLGAARGAAQMSRAREALVSEVTHTKSATEWRPARMGFDPENCGTSLITRVHLMMKRNLATR